MKFGSTLFLKLFIILIGLSVLGVLIFILPQGIATDQIGAYKPILLGLYLPAIPFFIGLYQAFKLLNSIDQREKETSINKVFSASSVLALKNIKYCSGIICVLFILGMPYIFYVATLDDAPGVALLGFIFIFASLVVATAAALFQKLLQRVIDIKSENELTV